MGSLKLSPAEIAERKGEVAGEYEPDPYGWGTCLNLTDEQIEAANGGNLQVGDRVRVSGWATVKGTAKSESVDAKRGRDSSQSLSLQVTDLELSRGSDLSEAAKTMYPGMN